VTQSEGAPTLQVFSQSFTVNANKNEAGFWTVSNTNWTLTCSEPWLTTNNATGTGFSRVTLLIAPNTSKEAREAKAVLSVPNLDPVVVVIKQEGVK
jgi:hypothetical protein